MKEPYLTTYKKIYDNISIQYVKKYIEIYCQSLYNKNGCNRLKTLRNTQKGVDSHV